MLINRYDLSTALRRCKPLIARKNTVPILSTVKLIAAGNKLSVIANNLDAQLERRIDGDGSDTFTTCPMFYDLLAAVRAIPGETISMQFRDGAGLILATPDDTTIIQLAHVFSVEDFPDWTVPKPESADTFAKPATFSDGTLQSMLRGAAAAMSAEETRYHLNGAYLHLVGRTVYAVAMDGHRLERRSLPLPQDVETTGGGDMGIVHRDAVRFIIGMKGAISFNIKPVSLCGVASSAEETFRFKLIDGTFPDYQRVIPQDPTELFRVDAGVLSSAISRLAMMADKNFVGARIFISDDTLHLRLRRNDEMAASYTIPAKCRANETPIAFNARYLAAMAAGHHGEMVFSVREPYDATNPTLITSAGPGLSVLMPMRADKLTGPDWMIRVYEREVVASGKKVK